MQKRNKYFLMSLYVYLFMYGSVSFASCVGLGCSCSVTATAVNFGAYDPFSSSANTNNGTVSVTCGALVIGGLISYQIQLSTGVSNNYTTRTMLNSGHTLNYNLYIDSSHTTIWGDSTNGTGTITDSYTLTILTPRTINHTVFGVAPARQNVVAGGYADTITVSVIY